MRHRLRTLFKVFLGMGVIGATGAGPLDAQQSSAFSSAAEAQAYLQNNPRGPLAEEAFRYLALINLRSVDPAFQSLPPNRNLDGIIQSDAVPNGQATQEVAPGTVATPTQTTPRVAQGNGGASDSY